MKAVLTEFKWSQGLKALYPREGGPGAVEVTPSDLARLDPDEFLNDTIIDFYMKCAPHSSFGTLLYLQA